MASKKTEKKQDYITTRSILSSHVENMLEFLSSKKQQAKNNSEDIFASFGGDESSRINWNQNTKIKTKLEVLKEEKNALGVYMSGNPLENFIPCLELLRKITGLDDNLHIAVIDKTKKIFTKAGAMMFALQLTISDQEIEGVIFSKKALKYSPILQENQLYWIIGNIDDKGRKKNDAIKDEEIKPVTVDTTEVDDGTDDTTTIAVEITEYVEKPKLLVSHISRFEDGFINMLQSSDDPATDDFVNNFPQINWQKYIQDSKEFDQFIPEIEALDGKYTFKKKTFKKKENFKENQGYQKFLEKQQVQKPELVNKQPKKLKVTLYKSLGEKISQIKKSLIREEKEGYIEIDLYVEVKDGVIKKVKGRWYLPIAMIRNEK